MLSVGIKYSLGDRYLRYLLCDVIRPKFAWPAK